MQVGDESRDRAAMEPRRGVYVFDLWIHLWKGRWIVLGTSLACAVAAAMAVLAMPSWYRAEVVLIPADDRSKYSVTGALAGLASLAGVGGSDSTEAVAVLKSREFTGAFIEEQKLLQVLFSKKWDSASGKWRSEDTEKQPDTRDGIRYFERKVRTVVEDRRTKLVTVAIEWKDPVVAAKWANLIVERLNDRMRARAFAEAQENVTFLRGELGGEVPIELQRSIGRLLESEMQKLMLARGNKDYAFRIVDRAQVPKRRSWPNRPLAVVVAAILGGALASLVVIFRATGRSR